MAISDPISDFLTRIRNSIKAQHRFVDIPWSKMRQNLAEVLKNQGFIENYIMKIDDNKRGTIRIFLKYAAGRKPVIQGLKRISKPGLRKYVGHTEIPNYFGGLGLSIVSTSQGVMAGKEALQRGIGGELLCLVW
jgi:small subunit ribosomal protein S8